MYKDISGDVHVGHSFILNTTAWVLCLIANPFAFLASKAAKSIPKPIIMSSHQSELQEPLLDEESRGDDDSELTELPELDAFDTDTSGDISAGDDAEDMALLAQLSTIPQQSTSGHSVLSASSLWVGATPGNKRTRGNQQEPEGPPPEGVHIDVLRRLVSQAAPGASTTDVCRDVVLPETAEGRCALLEQLRGQSAADGTPLVGPATVFVSHSWKFEFALTAGVCEDVAAKLEAEAAAEHTASISKLRGRLAQRWRRRRRFRRRNRQKREQHQEQERPAPVYFWLDLVVNSQHGTAARPFEWWCTTFTQSVGRIGHVALVLAPWDDPVPLTRAWCLWEIFSAFVSDARLTIHVPKAQRAAFLRTLVDRPGVVAETLTNVRAERAEATNPDDRSMIFAAIQEERGFGRINLAVKEQLRAWLVEECVEHCVALQQQAELEESLKEEEGAGEGTDDHADDVCSIGSSSPDDNGTAALNPGCAKKTTSKALESAMLAVNPLTSAFDRARFFRHTADLLREFGFLDDALEWYEAGLRSIHLHDEEASDDAHCMGVLRAELEVGRGAVLCDSGKLDSGLEGVRQGTEQLHTLAISDSVVEQVSIWATVELAAAHISAHRPSEAQKLLRDVCLTATETDWAAEHNAGIERKLYLTPLARALQLQGEAETQLRHYPAAISFTKLALRAQGALGGERSPAIGRLHCRAGRTFSMAGEFKLAFEHLDTSESIVTELLGVDHPEMGQILRERARAHLKLGQAGQALHMARRAATLQVQTLGPHHIETAKSMLVLASLHSARREVRSDVKALRMLRPARRVLEQSLGAQHALVLVARMEIEAVDKRMQILAHRRPARALCSGTLCASFNAMVVWSLGLAFDLVSSWGTVGL